MTKKTIALSLGLFFGFLVQTAVAAVPLVNIEGDAPKDIQTLLEDVIGEADSPARSLAQARRRAENAAKQAVSVMRSQGYYGANVKARIDEFTNDAAEAKPKAPQAILLIKTGIQFTFDDIKVSYENTPPKSFLQVDKIINKAEPFTRGKPAIASEVVAAELRAINYLKGHGHPDAKPLPRKVIVDHDSKTMRIEFIIDAGDKTRFGVIKQTGDAYIVQSWPNMVAPFETGDEFNNKQLNTLTSRIIATGVFDSATAILDNEKTTNTDGTVTRNILLNVNQGKINTIGAELGFSTTDGNGVDLSYERRNFIGYAQTLRATATAKTNQLQLGFDYNIPYFFRADRTLDLGFEIAREDTEAFTGERIAINTLLSQKLSGRLKVGIGGGFEASQFEEDGEDVTALLLEGVSRLTYDSRNSILDPVKGLFIETSATPVLNFGNENGFFTIAEAGASSYRRLSETLILAGRVKAGSIFGADIETVPLNRRFYGGGGGSVRGLGFQSISPVNALGVFTGGRSITEASAEIRYRGDSPFGAAAFLDAGNVTQSNTPNLSDVRYGAGVGIRYHTSFAPLRADIAIPLNKRAGDDDFQLYISIGQAF